MKILSLTVMFCLLSLALPLSAADKPKAPTRFDSYDGLEPGARAMAIGFAYVSASGDPASVYYNPAGLAGLTGNIASASIEIARQSNLAPDAIYADSTLRGRNLMFLSLSSNSGSFAWRPLSDINRRTAAGSDWEENEVKISAFSFSASHRYSDQLSSGLNLSYLTGRVSRAGIAGGTPYTNIADGNGGSMDFGLLITPSDQLTAGIMLKNLLGMMWWDDYDADQLPFTLRAGIGFQIASFMTFTSDWETRYYRGADAEQITHFGIEQALSAYLKLRAGIYGTDLSDSEKNSVTAGLGYESAGYRFDIAGERYKVTATDVYRYMVSLSVPL